MKAKLAFEVWQTNKVVQHSQSAEFGTLRLEEERRKAHLLEIEAAARSVEAAKHFRLWQQQKRVEFDAQKRAESSSLESENSAKLKG